MTHALILALLAQTGAYAARDVTLELPDGGTAQVSDGGVTGCWLDTGTCIERARERLEMQERVKASESKQQAQVKLEVTPYLLMGAGLGVLFGLAVGLVVGHMTSPTQPSP